MGRGIFSLGFSRFALFHRVFLPGVLLHEFLGFLGLLVLLVDEAVVSLGTSLELCLLELVLSFLLVTVLSKGMIIIIKYACQTSFSFLYCS